MKKDYLEDFVHFRSQSNYSILESILQLEDLLLLAKKSKMKALCLSDKHNLFAALEFSILSKKHKIQPIQGCIMKFFFSEFKQFSEILLIVQNEAGFRNLLKLIKISFTKNSRTICEHITEFDLKNSNEGLILLSGYTDGIIGQMLLENKKQQAVKISKELLSIFGNRFYFEIMRHGLTSEKQIEQIYIDIAYELNIPLIATNKILFHNKDKYQVHDVLRCISLGQKLENTERERLSQEFYFKNTAEMLKLFEDIPSAIENTVYLAQRCAFVTTPLMNPVLPSFDSPLSESDLLKQKALEGLSRRFAQKKFDFELYKARLQYELDVIIRMNFAGYFLIVADFVGWSKKNNIAVGPGRGSGAGSIVAWVLEITNLDPILFGLLFERFLNAERISLPDFDIDFCQEQRDKVIQYVLRKYGFDMVAHIVTFGKMQAKSVIKDVSRVVGLRYEIADYLTELVPFNAVSPVTLTQAIKEVKELNLAYKGQGTTLFSENNDLIKKVLSIALDLEGLNRNASTHAAGIVISDEQIIKNVPVYKDKNSQLLTLQYSMKYAELAGLVKFDFLGLQTLTLIHKTLNRIKEKSHNLDIDNIDQSDPKTYAMLSQGLSTGIFQFESQGIKNALKKLKPDNINDIIALGALYRPGPMDNIKAYISRKHGYEPVEYIHPMLESILKPTYGIIIYQEQVIEIAQKLANYTVAAADILRRAMGKKIKSEMAEQEERFLQGAMQNNISRSKAKSIFDHVLKFAGYGFNKSHASAYGVITYQTAYLKAHFTTEFMISLLNLEINDSDKISYLITDLQNFNIKMLPPSVNQSNSLFSACPLNSKDIIFALSAIKNLSKNLSIEIEKERIINGKYLNILDFLKRIDFNLLNKRMLENLIKSGAFSELHDNQKTLLHSVSQLMQYAEYFHQNRFSAQMQFLSINKNLDEVLVKTQDDLTLQEFAEQEFESLGLFVKNHLISEYRTMLDKLGIYNSAYIYHNKDSLHNFKLAGAIVKKNARMSKRGRFLILSISDEMGIIEVNIFDEELLQNFAKILSLKTLVVLNCNIFNGKIIVESIVDLKTYLAKLDFDLKFTINNSQELVSSIEKLQKKHDLELQNSSISFLLKLKNGFFAHIKTKKISNNFNE